MKKIKDILLKPITKEWVVTFVFLNILLIIATAAINYNDTDCYFIIATGRAIKAHGILYTNIFTVVPDLKIVVQQWLYCILISSVYDTFGSVGMSILNVMFACTAFYSIYIFIRQRDIKKSFALGGASFCLFMFFYNNLRPQWLTLILLILQCYFVEKSIKFKKIRYLYILPILVLFMINCHASYWIMNFILLLPYIILYLVKVYKSKDICLLKHYIKITILPFVLMIGALFINPYGINSILYVFRSYNNQLKVLPIAELGSTVYTSTPGVLLGICIIIFVILLYKRDMDVISFCMISGILLLCMSCYKWFGLYPIIVMFLFIRIFRKKQNLKDFNIPNFFIIIMILLYTSCTLFLIMSYKSFTKMTNDNGSMISYIENNDDRSDISVYTGFDAGSYVEFKGYKTYIDCRPELYMKSINGESDILEEYYESITGSTLKNEFVDPYEVSKSLIDKYNFDYIIVDLPSDTLLNTYLQHSDTDYDCVVDNGSLKLYKKKN